MAQIVRHLNTMLILDNRVDIVLDSGKIVENVHPHFLEGAEDCVNVYVLEEHERDEILKLFGGK